MNFGNHCSIAIISIIYRYIIDCCIPSFSLNSINLWLSFRSSHKNCSNSFKPTLKNNDLFSCFPIQYISPGSDNEYKYGYQKRAYSNWFFPTEYQKQQYTYSFNTFQDPRKKCNFDINTQCLLSVCSWLFRQDIF